MLCKVTKFRHILLISEGVYVVSAVCDNMDGLSPRIAITETASPSGYIYCQAGRAGILVDGDGLIKYISLCEDSARTFGTILTSYYGDSMTQGNSILHPSDSQTRPQLWNDSILCRFVLGR